MLLWEGGNPSVRCMVEEGVEVVERLEMVILVVVVVVVVVGVVVVVVVVYRDRSRERLVVLVREHDMS